MPSVPAVGAESPSSPSGSGIPTSSSMSCRLDQTKCGRGGVHAIQYDSAMETDGDGQGKGDLIEWNEGYCTECSC